MYDFYKMFYDAEILTLEIVTEATEVGVLTKAEFKKITGQAYAA